MPIDLTESGDLTDQVRNLSNGDESTPEAFTDLVRDFTGNEDCRYIDQLWKRATPEEQETLLGDMANVSRRAVQVLLARLKVRTRHSVQ